MQIIRKPNETTTHETHRKTIGNQWKTIGKPDKDIGNPKENQRKTNKIPEEQKQRKK